MIADLRTENDWARHAIYGTRRDTNTFPLTSPGETVGRYQGGVVEIEFLFIPLALGGTG